MDRPVEASAKISGKLNDTHELEEMCHVDFVGNAGSVLSGRVGDSQYQRRSLPDATFTLRLTFGTVKGTR